MIMGTNIKLGVVTSKCGQFCDLTCIGRKEDEEICILYGQLHSTPHGKQRDSLCLLAEIHYLRDKLETTNETE
jgi:hypothetical protein